MNIRHRVWEILECAKPGDTISRIFDITLITLIITNVMSVILDSVPKIHQQWGDELFIFEALSILIFTLEYIARSWSCVVDPQYSKPIIGRIRFAFRPLSIIDLVAIIPFYLPLLGVDLRVIRIFRLLRLVRILKLARYSKAFGLISDVLREKREELILTMVLLIFVLIVSASLMYYAEHEAQPENFSSIPAAIWWSVVTLTTVGYGDVYPMTNAGRVIGGVIAIIGIGIVALPAGIISAGFVDAIQNTKKDNGETLMDACPHCGKTIEVRDK